MVFYGGNSFQHFNTLLVELIMWKIYTGLIGVGGEIITEEDCNWAKLPKIPIFTLEWEFPNFSHFGKKLRMQGFEFYLYFHEDYHIFFGNDKKKQVRDTINFLGKKGEVVFQFSYSCRTGKAFQIKNKWGKEFRPLQLTPAPRINKKEPKRFNIDFGSPRKKNHDLLHEGIVLPTASAQII